MLIVIYFDIISHHHRKSAVIAMGQFLTLSTTIRVKTQLHHQTTLQKVGQWISFRFFFSQFAIICSHIKNLFSETVSKSVRWDSTKPWFNFFLLESKHETTNFIRLDSVAPSVLYTSRKIKLLLSFYILDTIALFFFWQILDHEFMVHHFDWCRRKKILSIEVSQLWAS